MRAWFARRAVEAHRLRKSFSTWVVIVFTSMPQMWSAVPSRYQDAVFALVPFAQTFGWFVWAAAFGVSFWKARNTVQSIPPVPVKP